MNDSALKGLLITKSDDMGPRSVVNLTKLSDVLAFKVALLGMTILMMGNSNPEGFAGKLNKLLGPLPVPIDPEADLAPEEIDDLSKSDALAIIFNVKADLPTQDPRALKNGRDAVIWFIFNSDNRDEVYKLSKRIEEVTNFFISNIKLESQLEDQSFFHLVLDEILLKTSEINIVNINEIYIPETIEYASFTLYKYDITRENILPIQTMEEIDNLPIIIFIDLFEKQINIIQKQRISKMELFGVGKSVSNLNLSLKRQFTVKNITDEIEIQLYLERLTE